MGTLLRRRYMGGGGTPAPQYLITKDSNAPLLAVCYAQGWCASPDYMTYEEAALVTSFPASLFRFNTQITHFEEIEYFGVTTIGNYCFQSASKLTVLGNMPYLTSAGQGCFRQMTALTSIGTFPNLMTLPGEMFFSTTNLPYVVLTQASVPTIGGSSCFPANSCPIYVPDEMYDTYQAVNDTYWNQVKSRITKLSEKP